MNSAMTLMLTIFYVAWLCAILALLYGIWYSSTRHVRRMEQTLIDVTVKSAEAAVKAAEAAKTLAEQQGKRP